MSGTREAPAKAETKKYVKVLVNRLNVRKASFVGCKGRLRNCCKNRGVLSS